MHINDKRRQNSGKNINHCSEELLAAARIVFCQRYMIKEIMQWSSLLN